jgi:putative transposase
MTAELRRRGRNVNHKRVERLMARLGLAGHRPRRRRNLTVADRAAAPVPDLIGGVFSLPRPDVGWVGDITYIPTGEGWLYLATVLDLASRRVVGWSMGEHHDAALVTDALRAAVAARGRARMDGTIFHSDRGGEYTSSDFARACEALGVRRSVGRTGICFDNAAAESFLASLKVERVNRRCYTTRAEARLDVFVWINRYNTRRLHSAIRYTPPVEWEHHHQRDRDHLGSTRAAQARCPARGGTSRTPRRVVSSLEGWRACERRRPRVWVMVSASWQAVRSNASAWSDGSSWSQWSASSRLWCHTRCAASNGPRWGECVDVGSEPLLGASASGVGRSVLTTYRRCDAVGGAGGRRRWGVGGDPADWLDRVGIATSSVGLAGSRGWDRLRTSTGIDRIAGAGARRRRPSGEGLGREA